MTNRSHRTVLIPVGLLILTLAGCTLPVQKKQPPTRDLTIFYTAEMLGNLEPCG